MKAAVFRGEKHIEFTDWEAPAEHGAEMFIMLKGTVHCETTVPGDGEIFSASLFQ